MVTYATSEESLADGAPLELYKVRVGGGPGAPVYNPSYLAVYDFESLADDAALNAAWTFAQNSFQASSQHLDLTGGVGGSKALRIDVSGTQDFHIGCQSSYTFTGLPASTAVRVSVRLKLDEGFITDGNHFAYEMAFSINGSAAYWIGDWTGTPIPSIAGRYLVVEGLTGTTNGSGELTVAWGWGTLSFFTVSHNSHIWCDNIRVQTEAAYLATQNPGTYSYYTSADVDVVYNGHTYLSGILTRTNLKAGGLETQDGDIELTLPRDHPMVELVGPPPALPVSIQIIRLHRADLTQAKDPIWQGQVVQRRFKDASADATLICSPLASLLDRKIPRRLTQMSCSHTVYDSLCQVNREDFTSGLLTVASVSGRTVVVTGADTAAGSWTTKWRNGLLIAPDGTLGRIDLYDSVQAADTLTLMQVHPGLTAGQQVRLVAGCDGSIEDCNHFDNTGNFGGERKLPIRNPGTGAGLAQTEGSA